MKERRAKYAVLRYKGRKYPKITITFEDGLSKSITVHADVKAARTLLMEIKRKIKLGILNIEDYLKTTKVTLITLNEFYFQYMEYRKKLVDLEFLSKATYQHDILALNLLINKVGKDVRLAKLNEDDIINFLVLLKDSINKNGKPYKPGAINSYIKHLKSAFSWAVREKLIIENPWRDVPMLLNPDEGKFRFISEENIDKIRRYLKTKPSWQLDVFNLGLWTGARRDELFNINTQSLYIDDIKGEKVPFVRLLGKGRKVRNMPLCIEACELLDRRVKYLTDADKQFELMDRSKSPTQQIKLIDSRRRQGYLFWEIVDSHSITKAFARVRKALGLNYFNVHSLRHSFATYCLKDEVPVTTVKEFLGHRDIKTTMIYAKTDDELKAIEIKKVRAR